MEILPLHIEYLLTRHDCVIVPGFGAFIATETEASIDHETGVIRPRRREISFNGSVVTDDGLLAHSIARREGLSYEDAKRLTAHLVERMTAHLNEEGEVSVGMVGCLQKDSDGLVIFNPRSSSAMADLLRVIRIEAVAASVEIPEVHAEVMDDEDAVDEDGMITVRVRPDRYVFTVSKRAVHAAAMAVAILTVGLSLLVPINHDNEQKASVISIEDFFHHAVRTDALKANDNAAITTEQADSTAVMEVKTDL